MIRVHTAKGRIVLNPLWIVGYKQNPDSDKGTVIYTADGNTHVVLDSPKSITDYIEGKSEESEKP